MIDYSLLAFPKPRTRPKPERKKDGRMVLKPANYTKFRAEIYERNDGKCDGCGIHVSLAEMQVHHIRVRGMGGGFRDDVPENTQGLCGDCHRGEHQ